MLIQEDWIHDSDDSEVHHHLVVNMTIVQENDLLGNSEEQISCWNKMKRVLAFVKKLISILRQTVNTKDLTKNTTKEYSTLLKIKILMIQKKLSLSCIKEDISKKKSIFYKKSKTEVKTAYQTQAR